MLGLEDVYEITGKLKPITNKILKLQCKFLNRYGDSIKKNIMTRSNIRRQHPLHKSKIWDEAIIDDFKVLQFIFKTPVPIRTMFERDQVGKGLDRFITSLKYSKFKGLISIMDDDDE